MKKQARQEHGNAGVSRRANIEKIHTAPARQYVSERVISAVSGRAVRTLQKDRLLERNVFPYYKLNRRVVYCLDEVLQIIESKRQGGSGVAA